MIAVIVAFSSCSDSASTAFENCAVTTTWDGVPEEVDFERPVPWVSEETGWHGNDALWVSLPPDGILPSLRSEEGLLETKFPWWRIRPGTLEVRSNTTAGDRESLDGWVPDGYGDQGFTPSSLTFSRSGCWRVTGVLHKEGNGSVEELDFVVWVCETERFAKAVGAESREGCGAN